MKIIRGLFLTAVLSIAGCAQNAPNANSQDKTNQKIRSPAIDPKLARELRDSSSSIIIIKAIIEERYRDVNAKMSGQCKSKSTDKEPQDRL